MPLYPPTLAEWWVGKFKVSIPLISMSEKGTCGQMKTSLLHTEGPANPKVWHLSKYSLLKGKSQRCSGDIKVSFFIASASTCVTGYQPEMCIMPVWESYSRTARQTKRPSPYGHFHSETDQSSFLSSPDEMKWVLLKDRETLHISYYLLLTCDSLVIPCQCPQSDHFHHSCPSMLLSASHHLVFTPRLYSPPS